MKNKIIRSISCFVALLGIFLAPFEFRYVEAHTPTYDAYADDIYNHSIYGTWDPDECLYAPDGETGVTVGNATFITIDMGEGEDGTGDLNVHYGELSAGANITIALLGDDLGTLEYYVEQYGTSVGPTVETYHFDWVDHDEGYRYVRLTSGASVGFTVDALEATSSLGETSSTDTDGDGTSDRDEYDNETNPYDDSDY